MTSLRKVAESEPSIVTKDRSEVSTVPELECKSRLISDAPKDRLATDRQFCKFGIVVAGHAPANRGISSSAEGQELRRR